MEKFTYKYRGIFKEPLVNNNGDSIRDIACGVEH